MYKTRLKSWGCFKYTRAVDRHYAKSNSIARIRSPDEFRIVEWILNSLQDQLHYRDDRNMRFHMIDEELQPPRASSSSKFDLCRDSVDEIIASLERDVMEKEELWQKYEGQLVRTHWRWLLRQEATSEHVEATPDVKFSKEAADFSTSVEMIGHMLVRQDIDGAFAALRRVPEQIQRLLREEPRDVLYAYFLAILKMNWDGEDSRLANAIVPLLLRYTATFAADPSLHWPPTYPLRRIFEGLARLDSQVQLPEVAIRGWKYYSDNLELQGGVTNNALSRTARLQNNRHARPASPLHDSTSVSDRLGINKDDIL